MKKLLTLLLAVVMAFGCLALTACNGGKNEGANTVTLSDYEIDTPDYSDVVIPDDFKIGFIFLHGESSTYDLNFMNAAREAIEFFGLKDSQYIMKVDIPEGNECYNEASDMVDQGCDIVFADSFGHETYMIRAARENPDVEFCHATGTMAHTEDLANFHNAFASIYEGRYLAGIAAGLKLKEMGETKMGYVGAFPYAEVKSGYTSFYLGAKSVLPEVTMEVTFTNSWYDVNKEANGATMLINRGCKLISQHADSMGAPGVCETNNVPNVSYNGSTIASCPNTFIVSSRINWAPYFKYIIAQKVKGEAIATDWTGTIKTGSVVLTELNADVIAEGTVEALDAALANLVNGSVKVFNANNFTVKGSKISSYLADVHNNNFAHDTEAMVEEGDVCYFAESSLRSAPYFDADIDGITILDDVQ